jgi:hypothetical protein
VFVGAYGGLRIGELAGLRRSRVPQDTGTAGTIDVAETAVMSRTGCCSGHPRPGPAGGRSGFLAAWSTNWRCRCTGMAGEVYDMVADVVEAIEEIFEGSSGLVGDVDEVAMRGSSDGLLDVTDLDLCPEIPLAVK